MNGLKCRPADVRDYRAVEKLAEELHALHQHARPDCFRPTRLLFTPEDYRRLLEEGSYEVHIAETPDGEVVAYAVLVFKEVGSAHGVRARRFCNLDEFCVSPRYRRQGVGRDFFAYLENRARLGEAESFELTVWSFNEGAAEFYESVGMTERVRRLEKKL